MKVFSGLILVFLSLALSAQMVSLEHVRKHYEQAVSDKDVCRTMISELEKQSASSIHLAYLGAFQAIWAGHVLSPFEKLNTFQKGKRNIEEAIKKNPDAVEIRFIRFSIQKHTPDFLGYRDDMENDKEYLIKHRFNVDCTVLKRMITEILKA